MGVVRKEERSSSREQRVRDGAQHFNILGKFETLMKDLIFDSKALCICKQRQRRFDYRDLKNELKRSSGNHMILVHDYTTKTNTMPATVEHSLLQSHTRNCINADTYKGAFSS